VEAGLDLPTDCEIPCFSIVSLSLKADHSPGEKELYTAQLAKEGKEPQKSVFRP
jgi:hypothetical protein